MNIRGVEYEDEIEEIREDEIITGSEPEDVEVEYDSRQRDMFNGFSEDLYGNNWFILTTNEAGPGGTKGKARSICGILEEVPDLNFSTQVVNGPQQFMVEAMQSFLGRRGDSSNILSTLSGKFGFYAKMANSMGANMNVQLDGNYTKRISNTKDFQKDGFKLKFKTWKYPEHLFDPSCIPSSQKEVIDYLSKYATVYTRPSIFGTIDHVVDQSVAVVGSIAPVGKKILGGAVGGAMDAVGAGIGSMMGSEAKSFYDWATESQFGKGFLKEKQAPKSPEELIKSLGEGIDDSLVRSWNDKQRITHGQEKFNESLHRLDILRAGILDTYLIVGVSDWSYTLEQDTLGETMDVSIDVKIDQRMSRDRLKLYGERENIFGKA